jgi:hypothetical protein
MKVADCSSFITLSSSFLLWRGAGVAELAALEMLCTGNCTVGSNPTLSATRRGQRSEFRGQEQRSEVRRQRSVNAKLVLTPDL